MELTFAQQSAAFLWSVPLGAALAVLYGVIKFIRFLFTPGKAVTFLLDIIFMVVCAVACFLFSVGLIQGYVRFYVFVGAAMGFAVYRLSVGRIIFMLYKPMVGFWKKILNKIIRKMKIFAKNLLKSCRGILYNIREKK